MGLISVENLKLRYPGQPAPALQGVDLDVCEGEFVVVSGSSGCGKTSLIRCLNGIIPHLLPAEISGNVRLKGQSLKSLSPQAIASSVGSVFQDPRAQFFHIDVIDEIVFGPENMGYSGLEIRRRLEEAVELFRIGHLLDKRMFDLSSGEKQKVIFAAVHAMGPGIYVLDEPSSNLDVATIEELRAVLLLLKKRGHTIVMVEHRLHYLSGLYDRLLIMEGGRIVLEAPGDMKLSPELLERYGLRGLEAPVLVPREAAFGLPVPETGVGIEAHCLAYRYSRHSRPALGDVSARFTPGTVTAIVGPNGSGKTTLIKLLGGLMRECEGEVRRDGRLFPTRQRLARCSLVMQESRHQLFFPSVRQELASGFVLQPRQGEAELLLEKLNLASKADAHPQTLSGGQQQRLVIGAALAARPELLILDEPTSGLDFSHMRVLVELILDAAAEGAAVLVVTHDLEFIQTCCDHFLFMRAGRVESACTSSSPDSGVVDFFNCGTRSV